MDARKTPLERAEESKMAFFRSLEEVKKRVDENTAWKRCPGPCGDEYPHLKPSGYCINCDPDPKPAAARPKHEDVEDVLGDLSQQ